MSFSLRFLARVLGKSAPIIGLLLVAFAVTGCSAVRLGYNTGPTLAYWWLDSYFDFDGDQTLRLRADLQAVQNWHRKVELPLLGQKLQVLQDMAPKAVTPEQVCRLVDDLKTRVQVTLERITPSIAAVAPSLQVAQIDNIQKEFAKRNVKWREEWIEGTPAERAARRLKQIVNRAESFYGSLTPAQLAGLRAHIASSSFDGPRQFRETQRRQEDSLAVLRKIRAGGVPPAQAQAELRGLLERSFKAPSGAYRSYMDQLTSESCDAMAKLHNTSTPEQRKILGAALKGYEADARALAAQPTDDEATSPALAPM